MLDLCVDRVALEKQDFLTCLPRNYFQDAITGDSFMKQIPLTRGLFALVDDDMFDYLSRHKWYAQRCGKYWYAAAREIVNGKSTIVTMHRIVNNTPVGFRTDHANRNTLDNRRCNLRNCDTTLNNANSKKRINGLQKYKGVTKSRKNLKKPYLAQIVYRGQSYYLGYYKTAEEAALAYNKKAKELFGEFARLNFEELVESKK